MVLAQLDIHTQKKKMDLDTDLVSFTRINSKWITELSEKHKPITFLEDNIGENLDGLGYGNDFLDKAPKA